MRTGDPGRGWAHDRRSLGAALVPAGRHLLRRRRELRRTPTATGAVTSAGCRLRLRHLARLGVTCLWLNPIHPTPHRDDGYDVADYYGGRPPARHARRLRRARARGRRPRHPDRHRPGREPHLRPAPLVRRREGDPDSPYRDCYVWSKDEPADRFQGMVFPGEQHETWSWCEEAGAWYYHRFYEFQPDLNWRNPEVRAEIQRVMGFWLQLGVAGFRVDAAPFVIELVEPGPEPDANDFADPHDWRAVPAVAPRATASCSARRTCRRRTCRSTSARRATAPTGCTCCSTSC